MRRGALPVALGCSVLVGFFTALAACADAGPPYVTDDPVPTDYRNWEIYAGLQYDNEGGGETATSAPFAEFNYGALPNVQVSLSLPMSIYENDPPQRYGYGYGTTEFGIKTRFVQESDDRPQISFYPSIEIPVTGGAHVETFLPLWLQKTSGPWTAFGGGGLYLNAGPGRRNYTFAGAAIEREISPATRNRVLPSRRRYGRRLGHDGGERGGDGADRPVPRDPRFVRPWASSGQHVFGLCQLRVRARPKREALALLRCFWVIPRILGYGDAGESRGGAHVNVVVDGDTTLTLNFEDMALIGNSLDHYADEYENFASIHDEADFHILSVRARYVATQFRASFGNPSIAELARAITARDDESR